MTQIRDSLEQVTGDPDGRYAFRTSPLRNIALQPTFFHNGSFTSLELAIRHHLNAVASANAYDPTTAGVDVDLRGPMGPLASVLLRPDPLMQTPIVLTEDEIAALVAFVRDGLHDKRATAHELRKLLRSRLPSGRPAHVFQ